MVWPPTDTVPSEKESGEFAGCAVTGPAPPPRFPRPSGAFVGEVVWASVRAGAEGLGDSCAKQAAQSIIMQNGATRLRRGKDMSFDLMCRGMTASIEQIDLCARTGHDFKKVSLF